MMKKIIISCICFASLILSVEAQQNMLEDKIKMDLCVSDSFFNQVNRFFNANSTILHISFKNSSPENVVIQKPIPNWNLFLRIFDLEGIEVYSSEIEFIQPVIEDDNFVEFSMNHSATYKFKLDSFGSYDIGFRNIKKIEVEYVPQDSEKNKEYPSLVLETKTTVHILEDQ